MDIRRTTLSKLVSRAWIPALVLVVAYVVWRVFSILPVWLEQKVSRTLREESIVVSSFPVERIGFNETTIGAGSLLYENTSLSWEAIQVQYKIDSLLSGNVSNVGLLGPVLSVKLDAISPSGQILPQTMPGDKVVHGESTMASGQAGGSGAEPIEPVDVADGKPPDAWELLQQIPLSLLDVRDGVIDIQLQEESQFKATFEGQLERQPFGISGEMLLGNPEFTMHISLRAPVTEQTVTLQAESALPVGSVRDMGNRFIELLENCDAYPRFTSSGQFVLDVFAEKTVDQPLYGSAQASMDEVSLKLPWSDFEVGLDDLVVAGFYKDEAVNLEGGFEILFPIEDNLLVEPFGFRFSLKENSRVTIESEVIDWFYSGMAGRCALLGQFDLRSFPAAGSARLETSFSKFSYLGISFEPFSILMSPDNRDVQFEASPLGIQRTGTIWLEDLKGRIDLDKQAGKGEFTWYGLLGQKLGTVAVTLAGDHRKTDYGFTILDKDSEHGLRGTVTEARGNYALDLSGQLVVPWINTLTSWLGYGSYKLGGANPKIETHLDWQNPLLAGSGRLDLDGTNLSIDGGVQLQGISGTIDFLVMILPRTLGKQTTHIKRLVSDPIELHDIEIEWELTHIRELVVHRLIGRIGDGVIELEPFKFNPLKPDVKTLIKIRKFDADLLRQWLKEERFSIEGLIAGQIPVGWVNGELVIGSGKFDLESYAEGSWLKFKNREFLRQKFASLGGIPVDLKDRLLNALWENGIRMDALEIYLGASGREGELSFRIAVNGETGNEMLEFPIGGFVINNLISLEDLATLMNLVAPIRIDPQLLIE